MYTPYLCCLCRKRRNFITKSHLDPTLRTSMKFLLASLVLGLAVLETSLAFVAQRLPSVSRSQTELSSARKPFITGNWKLNPATRQEAIELAKGVADAVGPSTPADVAIFVPFPFMEVVQKTVGDKVMVGAEVSFRRIVFLASC